MNGAVGDLVSEWLRTGVPIAAFVVSCMAVWFTRSLWVQSNRPVVSAEIRTHSGGNVSIAYDLAVINSGSRPAVSVRLVAFADHVDSAIEPAARQRADLVRDIEDVHRCFSASAVVPLLVNGQTVTNAFGHTGDAGGVGSLWRVGASIPITIEYADLEGRSFASRLTLVVRDTAGFAGSFWSESK